MMEFNCSICGSEEHTHTNCPKKLEQLPLFNLGDGRERRNEGRDRAMVNHEEVFRLSQAIAFRIARARSSRTADIDDVFQALLVRGYPAAALGKGAGKVFDPKFWEIVGTKQSTRITNHARPIYRWRLRE